MCRICYIPSLIKDIDYLKLFNELEKTDGGHGNGIGGFIHGKPTVIKGVKLSNDKILECIKNRDWNNGVIYHTRRASNGKISDFNVHPFSYNNTITCHNGTWSGANMAKMLMLLTGNINNNINFYKMNDSRTIALLIGRFGFHITNLIESGVILTITPKECIVNINGTFACARYGKKYIYASDFPDFIEEQADNVKFFEKGSVAKLTKYGPKFLTGGFESKKENNIYYGKKFTRWVGYGNPY